MIKKRGQQESFSFLISIIVFILIAAPIIIFAVRCSMAESAMEKTLDQLVEKTEKLKDGENGSVLGHIEEDFILVGFSKEQPGLFEAYSAGTCTQYGEITAKITKPKQCGEKACLCMCETGALKEARARVGTFNICDSGVCKTYGKDFNPIFYGGEECEYGPFIAPTNPTVEIFYQRAGENIGVCDEMPCLSEDIDKARKIFEEFYGNYTRCKSYNAKDCICGEASYKGLPKEFRIRLGTDGATTTLTLLQKYIRVRGQKTVKEDTFGVYNPEEHKFLEKSKMEIGEDIESEYEDYSHESKVMLYKSPGNYVSFVKSDGGFEKVKQEKMLCQEKKEGVQKMALIDTTLGGGIVYSELAKNLRNIGRVQTSVSANIEQRSVWFDGLYRDEDLNKDGSLKDEAYYILIDTYLPDESRRKVSENDYIEIFYASNAEDSKRLAESIKSKLSELPGNYFKDGMVFSEIDMDIINEYGVGESDLLDFEVFLRAGTGEDSGITQEDIIFTECKGSNANFITCNKNDNKKMAAAFIYIVDVEGSHTFNTGEKREKIAESIFEGVKNFLTAPAEIPAEPKEELPSGWKET